MHSFELADAHASEGLWALFSARSEIGAAISAMEAAGAALATLVDDSAWQSDGVRALHELLGALQDRTRAEAGSLGARAAEIEAVGGV